MSVEMKEPLVICTNRGEWVVYARSAKRMPHAHTNTSENGMPTSSKTFSPPFSRLPAGFSFTSRMDRSDQRTGEEPKRSGIPGRSSCDIRGDTAIGRIPGHCRISSSEGNRIFPSSHIAQIRRSSRGKTGDRPTPPRHWIHSPIAYDVHPKYGVSEAKSMPLRPVDTTPFVGSISEGGQASQARRHRRPPDVSGD